MRKILFLMMGLLFSSACSARPDFSTGGLGYKILDEATVAVGKISDDKVPKGKLVIPETVNLKGKTYTVTAVDSWGFFGCDGITEIVFPPTVTDIGMFAFCKNGISSVVIPETVKGIQSAAFEGCSKLKSVTLPSGLTQLDDRVFKECVALEAITLPETLTSIGGSAFSGSGIRRITLPAAVQTLGGYAFAYCPNLEDITLSKSLKTLGNSVFAGCKKLTEITFPEGVTSLGNDIFTYCPELTTVNIPSTLDWIASNPFSSCRNLTSINLSPDNPNFCLVDGILYTADMTCLISVPLNVKVEHLVIPEPVKTVASMACYDHSEIKSVKMTAVEQIGESAFNNCSGIATLDLGSKIQSISKHGFYSCRALTTLNLPESLRQMGFGVFDFCTGLKTVNVGETLANDNDNFHNLVFGFCSSDISFVVRCADGSTRTLCYDDLYDFRQRFPHR